MDEDDAGDAVDEAADTGVEAAADAVRRWRVLFAGVAGGCSFCAGGAVRLPFALRGGILPEARGDDVE